ncbi:MAG: hypothetical protein ABI912_09185 [Actinomycetota bacterium]
MDEYLRLTPSPTGAVSERMQALLSQAVEEQVNEQRQVQSLLNEVRSALAEVQRDARVSPGGQADLRADLANHAGETRSQLSLLDERLEAIVHAVGTSAQVLQGISAQLEHLGETLRVQTADGGRTEPVAQVRREVSDLRTRVEGFESAVRGDLSALQERLASDVDRLHGATEATSRTIANHVDNAVLVLAEALLRRPAASTGAAPGEPVGASLSFGTVVRPPFAARPEPVPEPEQAPEPEPDEEFAAEFQRESEFESEEAAAAATEAAPSELTARVPAVQAGAAAVSEDDPLWGSSLGVPPAAPVEHAPGTSTWADETEQGASTPATTPDAGTADDDEAGGLADEDRSDAPASGGRQHTTATAYDDPLEGLPTADEPHPSFGLPDAAPYDLERALFGVSSGAEVETADGDTDPDTDAATDGSDGSQTAYEPQREASHGASGRGDAHAHSPESAGSRRRPWWRPST